MSDIVSRVSATLAVSGRPRAPHYRALDAWRGVACLFVVLYHAVLLHLLSTPDNPTLARAVLAGFGALSVGVPMFFVISGYCIAAAADGTRLRGTPVRAYFVRRVRRIYPPLWAAIGLGIVCFVLFDVAAPVRLLSDGPWMQPRPWWYSGSEWVGNLTLTETWRHHLWGDGRAHFPGQAWTLCYEEQFYVLMGVLLLIPRHLLRGVLALTLITIGIAAAAPRWGWPIEGFFFDGNWLMFAAGVFVYFALNYGSAPQQVGLGLLLLGAVASVPRDALATIGLAFGFAVVLLVSRRWDAGVSAHAAVQPLAACGRMCYSLYLVHQLPVRALSAAADAAGIRSDVATLVVTVPVCVAASLLLAVVFHRLVERRFLNISLPARPAGTPVLA